MNLEGMEMKPVRRSEQGVYEAIRDILVEAGAKKIIEVGAGDKIAKRIFKGLDYTALNQKECDLNSEWSVPKCDALVAVEVIEHLDSPLAFLRKAKSFLKHNGMLIFSTPDNDSFKARLYFMKTRAFPLFFNEYAEKTHFYPIFERQIRHWALVTGWDGLERSIRLAGSKIFVLRQDS